MHRLQDYQRHAAECVLLAEQAADQAAKMKLLAMAQAWARLAELADRNDRAGLFYGMPPAPVGRPVNH